MNELEKRIKELELELEVEKKKNDIIKEYSNYALWEYDIATKRLVLSKKLDGKYSEYNTVIEDYQNTMHEWNLIHPDDWDVFDTYCRSMDLGDISFQYDMRQITDESVFVWLRYVGETIYNDENIPVKIVGKTIDISEEKKNAAELLELAQRDSLTNLYNKEATSKYIQKYIYNSNSRDLGGAFIIVDVDDFKGVNDTWGHLYGDFVLKQVANILTMCSSLGDIIGRIGGDEFCLFCKERKRRSEISKLAADIIENVNNAKMREGMELHISVGIALFPQDAYDYEELYQYADMALYEAKHQGKNKFCFYNEQMEYQYQNTKNKKFEASDSIDNSKQSYGTLGDEQNVDYNQIYLMSNVLKMNKTAYYVVDEKDFKILEASHKIQYFFPRYKEQEHCYESIFGRKEICENCPLLMNKEKKRYYSTEIYDISAKCFYDVNVQKFQNVQGGNCYLLSWRDMTSWAKKNGRMDYLTGALNYSEFYISAVEELQNTEQNHVLVMLGIYEFSKFNDLFGIENANELLKNLVSYMSKNLLEGEYICRMKGDDIYLLLNESKQDAKGRVERLKQTFEALMTEKYMHSSVRLYAGICHLDDEKQISAHTFDLTKAARKEAQQYVSNGNAIYEIRVNEDIVD